jgi:hypothetical protein
MALTATIPAFGSVVALGLIDPACDEDRYRILSVT